MRSNYNVAIHWYACMKKLGWNSVCIAMILHCPGMPVELSNQSFCSGNKSIIQRLSIGIQWVLYYRDSKDVGHADGAKFTKQTAQLHCCPHPTKCTCTYAQLSMTFKTVKTNNYALHTVSQPGIFSGRKQNFGVWGRKSPSRVQGWSWHHDNDV